MLEKLPNVEFSNDPDDNSILAMAIAGQADFIVSGDKRGLLALTKVGGTRIVTPRDFLKSLPKRSR